MNGLTSYEIKSLALEIYRLWKADRRKDREKDVEYLSAKAGNRLRIPKAAVLEFMK